MGGIATDAGLPEFHLNTYSPDCVELARRYGLGLELIEFAVATRMDDLQAWDPVVRARISGFERLVLHAPFHDLVPGSIDPEIQGVTLKRMEQAYQICLRYGINRMVCHTGWARRAHLTNQWVSGSAAFWSRFLAGKPAGFRVLLENVADEHPELLTGVVDAADDPRLAVCLDVGHANLNSTVPVADWIGALGTRTAHVHLGNNDGLADRHWRLDRGTIDMEETMQLLARHSPLAAYTLEAAEEEQCLRWLQDRGWLK